MQAYTGNITKAALLASLREHRAADRIVQREYWRDGRGCAVGCGIESVMRIAGRRGIAHDNHTFYAEAIGVPLVLVALQERIFERFPAWAAPDWPLRWAGAIPEGADLSDVPRRFMIRVLREVVLPVSGTSRARVEQAMAQLGAARGEWAAPGAPVYWRLAALAWGSAVSATVDSAGPAAEWPARWAAAVVASVAAEGAAGVVAAATAAVWAAAAWATGAEGRRLADWRFAESAPGAALGERAAWNDIADILIDEMAAAPVIASPVVLPAPAVERPSVARERVLEPA